ncbi:MAG: ribonuclease HII [Selenomonadaceae bacterium]|nr:ribonuclease HII [Selenomonadaceae bacterium]
MTIKEMEEILFSSEVSIDFLDELKKDTRKAAQNLLKKYEREQNERKRVDALYEYERNAANEGFFRVAGVDEAGRGPLAGPVAVAAAILPLGLYLPKLNDSKKLSESSRENLYEMIMEKAIATSVVFVDAKVIDEINIYEATKRGMYEALQKLKVQPDKALIDAMPLENLKIPGLSIVKGDAKSASIAAASILAKVTRDRFMEKMDKLYPEYGFKHHKGYGTKEHIEAIRKYGVSPIHRLTFEPIKSMIAN